jgi:bifunctional enzyme CysN/CysC
MITRGNATGPVAGESGISTVDVEQVSARMRARRSGHHGGIVWLTGLSGAGKSTIARRAESGLFAAGFAVYVLDGDRLRQGVNADVGYSRHARRENVRRVAAIAAILADAGVVAIVALISPTRRTARCVESWVGRGITKCSFVPSSRPASVGIRAACTAGRG